MRIAVVGSGYVGLVAGACFADLGHDVIVVDNDERKLAALKNGEVPIHEKFLPELLGRHRGHRLQFSDDLQAAVRASSVIFVAVGTPPTDRGDADLSVRVQRRCGRHDDEVHDEVRGKHACHDVGAHRAQLVGRGAAAARQVAPHGSFLFNFLSGLPEK